jgi:hypothetical protein
MAKVEYDRYRMVKRIRVCVDHDGTTGLRRW